jgi:hypothetical protein
MDDRETMWIQLKNASGLSRHSTWIDSALKECICRGRESGSLAVGVRPTRDQDEIYPCVIWNDVHGDRR